MSKRTFVMVLLLVASCKKKSAPQHSNEPNEAHFSFPALPPAPAVVVDEVNAGGVPLHDAPAIVVWRGGGSPPKTELSVRIWADGTVRFTCGKIGHVPAERVIQILDGFGAVGWSKPGATSAGDADPSCVTTSVQVTRAGVTERRNSGCDRVPAPISDAVEFVTQALGASPC